MIYKVKAIKFEVYTSDSQTLAFIRIMICNERRLLGPTL